MEKVLFECIFHSVKHFHSEKQNQPQGVQKRDSNTGKGLPGIGRAEKANGNPDISNAGNNYYPWAKGQLRPQSVNCQAGAGTMEMQPLPETQPKAERRDTWASPLPACDLPPEPPIG